MFSLSFSFVIIDIDKGSCRGLAKGLEINLDIALWIFNQILDIIKYGKILLEGSSPVL